jgi:hypothetical protein
VWVGGIHPSAAKKRGFFSLPFVFILLMLCVTGRFGVLADAKKRNRNTAERAGKKSSQPLWFCVD